MTKKDFSILVGLALFCTWLNSLKPPVIDDPIYLAFAQQISQRPLDPYGFEIGHVHASEVLAPPVALYWLGAGKALLGDNVMLLKWWLFPFQLIFVLSLWALFQRFAKGGTLWLVSMTALSPTFLPAMNLMLDVPALALALLSLVIFFRALDQNSLRLTLLAAVIAGLALQTKYVTFVVPVVMLLRAGVQGRWRLGTLAFVVSWSLFILWEVAMTQSYGESHFMHALSVRRGPLSDKLLLIVPSIGILGGIAPGIALLGEAGLRRSRALFVGLTITVAMGFLLLALMPEKHAQFFINAKNGKPGLTLNNLVVGVMGLWVLCTMILVGWRLWFQSEEKRTDAFLLLWLMLEMGACLALSPFPAVRRLMGVVIVMTLIAGRLVGQRVEGWKPAPRAKIAFAVGALLGIVFWISDYHGARAEQKTARELAQWIQQTDAGGSQGWFVGLWGMSHYCERAELKPVPCGEFSPRPGDFLILDSRVADLYPHLIQKGFQRIATWSPKEWVPLKTQACYYGGATAIRHREGSRFVLQVYRLPKPDHSTRVSAVGR